MLDLCAGQKKSNVSNKGRTRERGGIDIKMMGTEKNMRPRYKEERNKIN